MKLSELKQLVRATPERIWNMDESQRNAYLRSVGLEPGEIYQELEMESRFVDAHRDHSDLSSHISLHSHDFYELLYCRSCDDVEYLVGSERYRLQEGDILMMPPGVSHRPLLSPTMRRPYSRDVVWISREFIRVARMFLQREMDLEKYYTTLLRTAGTHWSSMGALFEACVNIDREGGLNRDLRMAGHTLNLLSDLLQAVLEPGARYMKAEKPELLDQVMAYVERDLSHKITLEDVAGQFYVSQSTVSHVFRQKMGISFYRYVTQRRLIAAKNLISRGLPMETVSVQVGFTDYSAFYRAFRQEYGISPRQYRNIQDSGENRESPG